MDALPLVGAIILTCVLVGLPLYLAWFFLRCNQEG